MKSAQDSVRQIEPFTSRVPGFDLAAAYEVAELVHRERLKQGARAVGRKIGFTNPSLFAQYGVRDPIWGYMYDTTVVQLQGDHGTCSLGRFAEAKIEPEIVLQFRSAPPPGATPLEIVGALGWIAHGFEIVQCHFPGWKFQAPDSVANGGLHAALLIGPALPADQFGNNIAGALESFTVALSCGGTPVERGRGSNVLGSPLAAMAHLLAVLARQPGSPPVQAGDIITTGTITKAYSIQSGQTWRTQVKGIDLPGLTLVFST
jgi:2-oxo-3-hexenedioate decarboxylase